MTSWSDCALLSAGKSRHGITYYLSDLLRRTVTAASVNRKSICVASSMGRGGVHYNPSRASDVMRSSARRGTFKEPDPWIFLFASNPAHVGTPTPNNFCLRLLKVRGSRSVLNTKIFFLPRHLSWAAPTAITSSIPLHSTSSRSNNPKWASPISSLMPAPPVCLLMNQHAPSNC